MVDEVNEWEWEQQLKDAIDASGMTNLDVAAETARLDEESGCGRVTAGQISRFRRGERSLSFRSAALVATVVGGRIVWFPVR